MNEPKISVIIPMYNAEKYIRECLVSVLASTFKDYEVLVVDDCSTDNSVAEVKKLLPHFDGRLKIFSTEKNSGGPGTPRNIGIKNSSGKYIFFIDNDDMILPVALENFFETAEAYGAEIVHAEKELGFNKKFTGKDLLIAYSGEQKNLVKEPTFEPVDLNYRVNHFVYGKFSWMPWSKFYRRDFLLENKIDFPPTQFGEDFVFAFKCLCLAKKYLLVPFAANLHRVGVTSAANASFSNASDGVRLWIKILLIQLAILDEFMSGLKFFRANPARHRDVLKFCTEHNFSIIKNLFEGRLPHEIQKIFFDELENLELNATGKNILTAYLCTEKLLAG